MRRNFWLGALGVALVLSLAWGYNEYRQAENLRLSTENQYRRAFTDLSSHLDQLETDLAKGQVATAPNQRILYLTQVWGHSESAMKDLAQLPAEQVGISYVDQFLNQISDLGRTLAQRVAGGGQVAPAEENILRDIHDRVASVNRKVDEISTLMDSDQTAWLSKSPTLRQRLGFGKAQVAEAAAEGQEGPPQSVRGGLEQLDASLQKLPPFSYSGEFSTKFVDKPLGLPAGEISREQSQAVARDFLAKIGYGTDNLEFTGETQGPFAGFQWKQGDASLEVSKRGGAVTLYRDQRELQVRTLSPEDAKNKAVAALKALGWNTMVLTSSEDFGSYLQLEAINEQDGIRIYPDKIRLMVGLDSGKLVGFDATPYYAYHTSRTISKAKALPLDKAKSKLRPDFQVTESRLALIPKMGNQEVFSWEFRGKYKGEEYLLYLNALNGNEEKIQRIIKTPRGEYLQ
ncbi:PepSY1/2 domain-containing protein [Paradesulfitobacterium ferrireducens]|uniref:PepSY1/2 domain-containing protein n=1 Tax=Paradesulfitobacterium ferrireducens TaxID=2816476 RepID=UPI001A9000C3|nr:PepSY1/2 domain-containing protein [Paradesulfitobacterium ferrireducens]